MKSLLIQEPKHTIESLLPRLSRNAQLLLERFNDGVATIASRLGKDDVFARTHIQGLSYFATRQKAFVLTDFRSDFVSARFYTGRSTIEGLEKANWLSGGDNAGCKMFRIADEVSLSKALAFAEQSLKIALAHAEYE